MAAGFGPNLAHLGSQSWGRTPGSLLICWWLRCLVASDERGPPLQRIGKEGGARGSQTPARVCSFSPIRPSWGEKMKAEYGERGVFHRTEWSLFGGSLAALSVESRPAGHDIDSAGNVPFSDRTSPTFFRLFVSWAKPRGGERRKSEEKEDSTQNLAAWTSQNPSLSIRLYFALISPASSTPVQPSVTPWPAFRYDTKRPSYRSPNFSPLSPQTTVPQNVSLYCLHAGKSTLVWRTALHHRIIR